MIRLGAKSDVQFAGHYTIPQWGCGSACGVFVIVDSITGTIYDGFSISELPFKWLDEHGGEEKVPRMEFYTESNLLKISACPDESNCGLYDYVMVTGKGLKLVRKEPLPDELH
jgi:hypothetical protein